jgi:RND family efflux transporter MFP subunit
VSGQFTTDDATQLSFKTGGIVHAILVKEGDRIHAGQLLATLDLTEINTQMQQAQLALEKTQRDYQRVQHLYADSVATLEQLQNAKTALDLATQQAGAVKFNQNYSEIRATHDGDVLRKLANPGQVVNAGSPIIQVNGNSDWYLRVGLSDKQWAQIKIGDKAHIETGALPGKTLRGTITKKSEGVDPATGTFTVDIRVEDPKGLAEGLFGKGVIETMETQGSVAIPYQALLDGDGSSGYVFVTDDGHTAHKIKVRLGGMEKDKILITDGLGQEGYLIISGSAYLNDGSPIHIKNPQP